MNRIGLRWNWIESRSNLAPSANTPIYRAVGAGAAVARLILKIAPGATHGERVSRKLLGYIKKQQIVEFMPLHSKNALEMV